MKNTPEIRAAFDKMILAVNFLNEHCNPTGYQIKRRIFSNGEYITLYIRTPDDSDQAAFPAIYFCDDDEIIRFKIATVGYGDHSLAQAERAIRGLFAARDVVTTLYATAEACGLKTIR